MNDNKNIFVARICEKFEQQNPNPNTDLKWKNDFTLAVSVLLSAQTTDNAVNKATAKLFEIADTPEKMLSLGLNGIKEHIRTIGLFNNKSKSIISMCKALVEDYGGKLPDNRDDLQKLAGIGRKSANVIMNVLYGKPFIAVDTHVIRIVGRMGISSHNTPKKIEDDLERLTPERYKSRISNWLVLHGRYVCKAKKPECARCFLKNECMYKKKDLISKTY